MLHTWICYAPLWTVESSINLYLYIKTIGFVWPNVLFTLKCTYVCIFFYNLCLLLLIISLLAAVKHTFLVLITFQLSPERANPVYLSLIFKWKWCGGSLELEKPANLLWLHAQTVDYNLLIVHPCFHLLFWLIWLNSTLNMPVLCIYTTSCELGYTQQFSFGQSHISAVFLVTKLLLSSTEVTFETKLKKTFQHFLAKLLLFNFLWVMALCSGLINLSDIYGQNNCGDIITEVSQLHVTYTWPSWQPWGGMPWPLQGVFVCPLFQGMSA